MISWILFISVPSLIGGLALLARICMRGKRKQVISLIVLDILIILTLYLLLVFTRDNDPETRFYQFALGALIGLFFMVGAFYWPSKITGVGEK